MKSKEKNNQTLKAKKSLSLNDVFFYIFRGITFPFYLVYLILFKVPDSPAYLVGILRFAFFVWIASNTETVHFNLSVENFIQNLGMNKLCAAIILGIQAIVLLINLFLSFVEMFGFHDATNSGVGFHDSNSKNNNSNFDSFSEALEYRDSLLRAKHTPDKIKELKKTGFITNERILNLNQSAEVSEAFELANSQMRALHTPDKYKMLKSLFGH